MNVILVLSHLSQQVTKHWVREWAVELWRMVFLLVKNIGNKLNSIIVIFWYVVAKSLDI